MIAWADGSRTWELGSAAGTLTGTSSMRAWLTQRRMPTTATSTSTMHAIPIAAVFQVTLLRAVIPADDDLDVAALHGARSDVGILDGQPFGDLAGDVLIVSGHNGSGVIEARRIAG